MTVVVDSNILILSVLADEPLHTEAQQILTLWQSSEIPLAAHVYSGRNSRRSSVRQSIRNEYRMSRDESYLHSFWNSPSRFTRMINF